MQNHFLIIVLIISIEENVKMQTKDNLKATNINEESD